jgi:GT2 family glycosyltransferase
MDTSDTPRVSLTAIARRRIPELDRLVDALLAVEGPAEREVVVGVETPGTLAPVTTTDERGVVWIALPPNRGVAYNRNRVLDAVRASVMVSADDDCVPKTGWLTGLLGALEDPSVHAAVGSIEIPPSGFVGDSISALGFPAGGTAGYETMFPVGANCDTTNIAVGNCAIRTDTLRELGGFDESMSWGGEDTELAYRFGLAEKRIVFVRSAQIVHPARTNLWQFSRWLFIRGRAKRQFARKVPISGFVSNRLASYGRIISSHARDPKIVLIVPLLGASLLLQQAGFAVEWLSPRKVADE